MIGADLVSVGYNAETEKQTNTGGGTSELGAKKGKWKEKDVFIWMTSGRCSRHLPG